MNNIVQNLKFLLEKAKKKKPKKYHQDYIDIQTWKDIINHILYTLKIEDKILPDDVFPNRLSNRVFQYLDSLPSLDGISENQVVELTNYLSEIFDLLLTNQSASKVVDDLYSLLDLLNTFEKEIPPPEAQVSQEDPEDETAPSETDLEGGVSDEINLENEEDV